MLLRGSQSVRHLLRTSSIKLAVRASANPITNPTRLLTSMSGNPNDRSRPAGSVGANYHRECTGAALETVNAHSEPVTADDGITLFGANFCPFVQRTWIVLEVLGAPYRYYENDPYKKTADLLAINPKGLVPSLKIGLGDKPGEVKGLSESSVINEYLLERFSDPPSGRTLLPPASEPYARALHRIAVFRGNQTIVSSFYRFLQSQPSSDSEHGEKRKEYLKALTDFTESMDKEGPFWGGKEISLVDVNVFPWVFRTTQVLKHFRNLEMEEWAPKGGRTHKWLDAMLAEPAVKATCSTEELYLDSYARYAENRPGTSQVAEATNKGRGLP